MNCEIVAALSWDSQRIKDCVGKVGGVVGEDSDDSGNQEWKVSFELEDGVEVILDLPSELLELQSGEVSI